MWRKGEEDNAKPQPRAQTVSGTKPSAGATTSQSDRAIIGRSITVQGDVTGEEDLFIQGRVEGSVDLGQHSVTVGPDGRVKASITARAITVEGNVEGNLVAEEHAVLRSSAQVQGDIKAPRVILEDGAEFRGGVDMANGGQGATAGTAASARSGARKKDSAPADGKESATKEKDQVDTAAEQDR